MITNVHVTELIPAYALNCLDPDEVDRVMQHLATCTECQAELRSYQAVVDQLPFAAPSAVPSLATKETLMKRIGQSSPRLDMPAPGLAEKKPSLLVRINDRLRIGSPAWSLAGMALIAVLLVSNIALLRQFNQVKSNGGQTVLRVINLANTSDAPQATGMIVMSQNGEQGTLVVDGLPALAADRAYQLWLIKDGKRTSGGVFSVDYEGYASLWVAAPSALSSYQSFGITVEPAGGSPGPTGKKVLGGSL